MIEVYVNLIQSSKSDLEKLRETISQLPEVKSYSIDLQQNILKAQVSSPVYIQHIINEINMKTGFKAF